MFLNDFSVTVRQGKEVPGGYVELEHGKHYTLSLRNNRALPCDAHVEIDGKHVGTWRINPFQTITLERPAHDAGRFTFYLAGSAEGEKAGIAEGDPSAGLVKVVFTPGTVRVRPLIVQPQTWTTPSWPYTSIPNLGTVIYRGSPTVPGSVANTFSSTATISNPSPTIRNCCSTSAPPTRQAGGTGLSGHSSQQFGVAQELDYDLSQQATIHLRLVGKGGEEPRPLTVFATPVPPPV